MAFEGTYVKEKEIGKFGSNTVELGHYESKGTAFASKIYIVNHFQKRNGTDDSRVVAKFTVDEAKEFAKIMKAYK